MDVLFERIWERKVVFLSTFFIVFTLSYIALLAIDFVPEKPQPIAPEVDSPQPEESVYGEGLTYDESSSDGAAEELAPDSTLNNTQTILPISISISKLDRTVTVLNPVSRNIADLDEALLQGVVRHPDSATLDQDGAVFILGHSSYLPQVLNKNFQAFNGIQNLEWGDLIEVTSKDIVYEYRVEKVYRARAQDVTVPIAGTGRVLTLATCNSFGTADDRYIVEAKQVGTRNL